MSTGSLVVTFFNTHSGPKPNAGSYHFLLYRACDPNTILGTFKGDLAYGEQKTYTIEKIKPGNYQLVGLKLPDPKPGNVRHHNIQIFAGLETVYDVCYLKSAEITF